VAPINELVASLPKIVKMKKQLIIIFLLIIQFSYSQPGERDFVNSRIRQLEVITDSLAKNPKNYELIWERTELIFRPFFSMYSRPRKEIENDTVSTRQAFYEHSSLKYKNIDILDEINKLINNANLLKTKVTDYGDITNSYVNKSNFYYKRGQYYYLKNELTKSLADYLTALNSHPDKYTKTRICIAIAAYYFNLGWDSEPRAEDLHSQLNLEKALEYIDMISPQFDKEILDLPSKNHLDHEGSFEQEKLKLLEMTKKYERLANFHINKTYSLFNLYNKLIDQSKIDKTENNDTIKRILGFAIKSFSESEKYLSPKKINLKIETE
jgi:tetratricopeptide (TPR) repeat protein